MDHFAIDDIEFIDETVTEIPRTIVELESFSQASHRGASSTKWGFTSTVESRDWDNLPATLRNRLSNGTMRAEFRIRDAIKTSVPPSGEITITDNTSIDQNALVADATGRVSGVFTIPDPNVTGNPKFRTGSSLFRLTSNSDNSDVGLETFAENAFSSTGIMEFRQKSFIATRNADIVTSTVLSTGNTTQVTTTSGPLTDWTPFGGLQTRTWVDPLAQSVMCTTLGGEFLTKLDVFFSAKDTVIPVELQLREMENGGITNRIIPLSRVILPAEDIVTSADGSVASTFTFDAPVYIAEGVEFAIVLLTDSEKYTVFISKMGELDLQGNRTVSKQPYLGVLFKSQNNSTWTSYDFEDLKFKLYRAQFDTTAAGVLNLENFPVPENNLVIDPIECFAGASTIKVKHYGHDMYNTNNKVTIRGVTSNVFGTLDGAISSGDTTLNLLGASAFPTSGTVTLRISNTNPDYVGENDGINNEVSEIVTGTISGAGAARAMTGMTRGIGITDDLDHVTGLVVELYQYNGISLDQINTTHSVVDYGLDYYTATISDTATEDLTFGGANVFATENALVTNYQIIVPTNVHTDTAIVPTLTLTSGTSANGTETSFSVLGESGSVLIDQVAVSKPLMVASSINETNNFSSNKSLNVKLSLTSTQDNLSPVVDLERTSFVAMSNRLSNIVTSADYYPVAEYVSPTAPEGDLGEGIYMTKQVQLSNPASSLKVYLAANVFSSSNLQLMYKVLRTDESTEFGDLGWTYFNTAGESDLTVSPATSVSQMQEYEFSADDLPEFISFAIKIKMDGTDCAVPPICKDLRAIALAT